LSSYLGTSTPARRADTVLAKSTAICTWRSNGSFVALAAKGKF
jgi:hypothetical protein